MKKQFEEDYRGVGIWYDEGHNFWRSESSLKAREKDDLKTLIDREATKIDPIPCIMVEMKPSLATHCKILEIFDNGNLRIENPEGKVVTLPPDKFYKDTPENRDILKILTENGEKMRELAGNMEKL